MVQAGLAGGEVGAHEEVCGGCTLGQVAKQEMGLPLELLLGASCPTEPSNADDGEQLFERGPGAPHKVFEVAVRAVGLPFSFYAVAAVAPSTPLTRLNPKVMVRVSGVYLAVYPPVLTQGAAMLPPRSRASWT